MYAPTGVYSMHAESDDDFDASVKYPKLKVASMWWWQEVRAHLHMLRVRVL